MLVGRGLSERIPLIWTLLVLLAVVAFVGIKMM